MNRISWLREKRTEAREKYDTLWAPYYDADFGIYENTSHQHFIQEFLHLLPQNSLILDAACGTGRYVPFLLEAGHSVIGIDQSEGMLGRAREKFPQAKFANIGLQELSDQDTFDGAICMDALEHVCPEDWFPIFKNLHRALKQPGYLYFTVEIEEETELKSAYERGQQLGWPIAYGEWADGDVYHYYPAIERVRDWIRQAGFGLIEDGEGDKYHHFIVRVAA